MSQLYEKLDDVFNMYVSFLFIIVGIYFYH